VLSRGPRLAALALAATSVLFWAGSAGADEYWYSEHGRLVVCAAPQQVTIDWRGPCRLGTVLEYGAAMERKGAERAARRAAEEQTLRDPYPNVVGPYLRTPPPPDPIPTGPMLDVYGRPAWPALMRQPSTSVDCYATAWGMTCH